MCIASEAEYGQQGAVNVRRLVNDDIYARHLEDGDVGLYDFVCECGDLLCTGVVRMTPVLYRRSAPGSVVGSHAELTAA